MRYRNVYRVDLYSTHAWVVAVVRRRKRIVHYFSDGMHGGRAAALAQALRYRDDLVASLPPPMRFKRTFSRNKTGVVGVQLEEQHLPSGRVVRYYGATWTELSGKRVRVRFLISRYGEREARRLAIKARREAVARILSQRGARVYWQR